MAKLIIMQGLPGSGKSTKAKEIMEASGNTVRINRDLLREMLHFSKWTGRNEEHTVKSATMLANNFLMQGINVIVDDTNLNQKTVQRWKDLAKSTESEVEYVKMETSIADCILHDAMRANRVGAHVIKGMALQNSMVPVPKKGFVIFDIDGTLADTQHRVHYVKVPDGEKKDWQSFFNEMRNDKPRIEIVDMLMEFEGDGYDIILVSGRPDNWRDTTEIWLENVFKGYQPYYTLLMRRAGDKRPDTQVKEEIYNTYLKHYPIHKVVDDRPSVIRMWKEKGLDVIDVGNGEEF